MNTAWDEDNAMGQGDWFCVVHLLSDCCSKSFEHNGGPYHLRGSLDKSEPRPPGRPECKQCGKLDSRLFDVSEVVVQFGRRYGPRLEVVEDWLDRCTPALPLEAVVLAQDFASTLRPFVEAKLALLDSSVRVDWSKVSLDAMRTRY